MVKKLNSLEQIQKILREDPRGLTIQEIAGFLKVSRITASIALAKLDGLGVVDVRVVGNCRLHYLRRKEHA